MAKVFSPFVVLVLVPCAHTPLSPQVKLMLNPNSISGRGLQRLHADGLSDHSKTENQKKKQRKLGLRWRKWCLSNWWKLEPAWSSPFCRGLAWTLSWLFCLLPAWSMVSDPSVLEESGCVSGLPKTSVTSSWLNVRKFQTRWGSLPTWEVVRWWG